MKSWRTTCEGVCKPDIFEAEHQDLICVVVQSPEMEPGPTGKRGGVLRALRNSFRQERFMKTWFPCPELFCAVPLSLKK